MPKLPNPQTPEAETLTKALLTAGTGKAAVADALDVSPGLISQYASGHRPVPWDRAKAIATLVGVSPESISAEYRRIVKSFGQSQAQRPTAETILAAVRLASGAATGVGLGSFEIETEADAELFALAFEEVLDDGITVASDSDVLRFARKLQTRKGKEDGQSRKTGSNGGTDRAAGKAEAGDAARPAASRAKKRASGGSRG